jgi:hypothetical protein
MDDATISAKRDSLDQALETAGPNVGIAFGLDLFKAFRERGWLTLETFGASGTTLFAERLPAYQQTHYVFATWDLGDWDFKVGSHA